MVEPAGRPPVVLIGLDSHTGLQSARIFHGRGVPVLGLAAEPAHPCCRTRACRRLIATQLSGEALVESLRGLAGELEGPAVLLPCTDNSVLTLSRHRGALPACYVHDLPEPETLETLLDKWRFYRVLREGGLPLSATAYIRDGRDAERAARDFPFPGVLKPAVKTPLWLASTDRKVFPVPDAAELLRLCERCLPWSDRLVLQEWVPGGDDALYTSNCYFNRESEMLVGFVTRKIRQWPEGTGSACLARAQPDAEVLDASRRLFQQLGYRGLGYLETKRHPGDGRHFLIEANIGRPTGRSATAEACGVPLLYTKYCDNLNLPLPPTSPQPEERRAWIHLRQDLQASLRLWKQDRLTVREWLRSLKAPRTYALESWGDPAPALFDLLRVTRLALRRFLRRLNIEH